VVAGNVVDAAAGEVRQFASDALHVAAVHVVVDPADVAHVRRQALQLFVATNTQPAVMSN